MREQLCQVLNSAPLLGVAYCLTDACYSTLWSQPHLSASADVGAANTLTLLIKMPAKVTFYKTPSNPVLPALDYLPDHYVHRNYFQIITFFRRQTCLTRPRLGLNSGPRSMQTSSSTAHGTQVISTLPVIPHKKNLHQIFHKLPLDNDLPM